MPRATSPVMFRVALLSSPCALGMDNGTATPTKSTASTGIRNFRLCTIATSDCWGTLEVLQLTIVTPVSQGRFLIKEHCMVDFASAKQSIVNNSTGMKSPANWNSFEDKGIS